MVRSYIITLISTKHAWNWGLQRHLGKCSFISARHWRSVWSAHLKVNSPGRKERRKKGNVHRVWHVRRVDHRRRGHQSNTSFTKRQTTRTLSGRIRCLFVTHRLAYLFLHFPSKQPTVNQTKKQTNTHKYMHAAHMQEIYCALPVGLIN